MRTQANLLLVCFARWLAALVLLSAPRAASAAPDGAALLRIGLLPKVTLAERSVSDAALEANLGAALSARGARIVDLARANEAQRLAWSDGVRAGRLPEGVTLLLADALYSAQLDCFQASGGVLGTALVAVQCTLTSKLVRVDSGDVAFSEVQSLAGHGLNAAAALDTIARVRLAQVLPGVAQRAVEQLDLNRDWSLDLVVSELADADLARRLVATLEHLPGVVAARMVFFKEGLVKYLVSGRGAANLAAFSTSIEKSSQLPLELTYAAPRVIHAQFDLARALPRPVMVLGLVKAAGRSADRELPILRAGLRLVPYLEPAHASPVIADISGADGASSQIQQRAVQLGVPLILQLSLVERDQRWFAGSSLIEVASGRHLLSAASSGSAPEAALTDALHALDQQYRGALADRGLQRSLGLAAHVTPAPREGVVVDAFRLVRRGDRDLADLMLRNVGPAQASALTARIHAQRKLLATLDLGHISAGATLNREIALGNLPTDGADDLRVEVDYQFGDERRRAERELLRSAGAGAPEPGLDAELPPAYHELVKTAVRHYNAGDWLEARRLFRIIYAAAPNARVARALGMVEFDLRDWVAARRCLGEALDSRIRPLSSEQAAQVRELLAKVTAASPAVAGGGVTARE